MAVPARNGILVEGIRIFAGTTMLLGGAFQALQALAALVHDEHLLVLRNYVLSFDLTVWGSIHLVVGLALALVGVCLLLGKTWARTAGIVVAAISAAINFSWLPISPGWAIVAIAIDMLVVWALATGGAPESIPQQQGRTAGRRTA